MEVNWLLVFSLILFLIAVGWLVHIIKFIIRVRRGERLLSKINREVKDIETKLDELIKEFAEKP